MTREEAIKTWLPIISMSIDNMPELKEAFDMAIKALEQEPKIDLDELKRKILMEVDGGTDDKWLRYADVCDRISNSIDEYKADRSVEE